MTNIVSRSTLDRLWTAALRPDDADAPPPRPDLPFSLAGGHSLAAARLVAGIRGELGRRVSIVELLRADPSPDDVAAMVEAAPPETDPLAPVGDTLPVRTYTRALLPRSAQPVWAFHRLHPESAAYNVLRVVTVHSRIEPRALRAAADALAERHDALRCVVGEPRGGRPELIAAPTLTPSIGVQVVRLGETADVATPPADPDWGVWAPPAVEAALRAAADRPFDMATAPLWRVHMVFVPELGRSWLLVACHHLIADLRSSDVLIADLAEAYDAARRGDETPRPVAASLVAYLAAEGARDAAPDAEAVRSTDLEWWARTLGERAEAGPLPLATEPAVEAGYEGDASTVELDLPTVKGLARACRVTTATVLLAAATAVLTSWRGGGEAIVVGIPSARSIGVGLDDPVGFLVDTVPVRAAVDLGRTFADVCQELRGAYLDALDHASVSMGEIMARLAIPRRSSRSTVIDLWFNDLQHARCPDRLGDAAAIEYDLVPSWSLFLSGLYVRRSATGLRLHGVVPRGTMAAGDLAALLRQIAELVTRVAGRPGDSVADLVAAPDVPGDTLPLTAAVATIDRLDQIGVDSPHAVAVRSPRREVSYAELAALARAASTQWDSRCLVALGAEHDIDHIVNLLGVVASGASVALVDRSWPADRQRAAVELCGATHTCGIDADVLEGVRLGAPADGLGGDALQFTSGSTGAPLTVATAGDVRLACIEDLGSWLGVRSDDRASFISGPAHDPSWRDLGLPLRAGAMVCLPPDEVHGDPSRLVSWLRDEAVSIVSATPPLLGLAFEGEEAGALPALRLLVVGGAPLSAALAGTLREVAPNATLVNGYGCTETPQLLTALRLEPGEALPAGADLPVGLPFPGRTAEVRTASGARCDVGQLGSVRAGAPHIADGYVGLEPGAGVGVAERFGTDEHGRRWFDTGDLARVDAAGHVILAGRADRQRLINGHRVVLDDIEAVARAHPDVGEAVAVVVNNGSVDVVRMFVRPASGSEIAEPDLRESMRSQLPAAAVPGRIIVTDEMSVSANLKPVAPTAPPTAPALAAVSAPAVAPAIAQLAESILGKPLRSTDNFFEAGFNSLTLLQFSAELAELLQREVPAIMMFRHASLQRLLPRLGVQPPTAARPAPSVKPQADTVPGVKIPTEGGESTRDRRRGLRQSIARKLAEGA